MRAVLIARIKQGCTKVAQIIGQANGQPLDGELRRWFWKAHVEYWASAWSRILYAWKCFIGGSRKGIELVDNANRRSGRSVKTARFLAEFSMKRQAAALQNSLKKVADNYDNSYYHNHRIQSTPKNTINRIYQMINDLKLGQNNSDNLSLVQGCKLIMPILTLLTMQEICTYF